MRTAFTTRAHTRFTAATSKPFLILTCAKRSSLLFGTIARQWALRSRRWALRLARITLPTVSSSTQTSSNAVSGCPASTTCATLWTACTTTIFISTIPSITSQTRAIPGSTARLQVATFTSAPVRVRGRTAGRPTASPKFSPAKASAIRWTTGARRAATTGPTGSIRCANTSRNSSEGRWHRFDVWERILAQAQMLELISPFFDDLVVVDPDVALARKHVNVRLGCPVTVRLAAVRIAEGDMHAGEFFILKKNPDHLG